MPPKPSSGWHRPRRAETGKSKERTEHGPAEARNERGKDPKSQMILAKLDEPISMSFNEDTPLEDVLKYIKQATTTKTYQGIPIYVDPVGLQEAEKSMTSTVRNMDLEGVPLRRTLQLLLKQLDLIYFVEDGMLYITSNDAALSGRLGPAIVGTIPDPAEGRESRARGALALGDEGTDRAPQNPRADHEARGGSAWRRNASRQRKSRPQNAIANR